MPALCLLTFVVSQLSVSEAGSRLIARSSKLLRLRSDSVAQNITTLQQHYKKTTDNGQQTTEGGSLSFAFCLSSFDKTLQHYNNITFLGQQTTDRAEAGLLPFVFRRSSAKPKILLHYYITFLGQQITDNRQRIGR